MIPWLLVMELISTTGKSLSELVGAMMLAYPSPGEINRSIEDPAAAIDKVRRHYQADALVIDETDGISMEFADWRFNLRMSNTEPLVRLNLETRADVSLLKLREKELLNVLEGNQ
jgi:phosphomannomutase